MTLRTVLLHLRLPFSLFLLPVFWFALSQSVTPNLGNSLLVAFILHFLLYPASNAYNSYFDKDEESIGILENPPPVNQRLHYVAWGLDILALVLGTFVGWPFVLYLFIYGLISKGELPVMKRSKRCYFSKIELINYLKQGRKKTVAETASEADTYLKKKGGYNA